MRLTSRTTAIAVSVVAVLGVTSVAALAASDDGNPGTGERVARPAVLVPRVMPSALASGYSIFRRQAGASESLGRYVAPDSDYVTELGLNPSLARRVATGPGFPTKLWIAPTADGTCLFILPSDAIGPGGNCGSEMTDDPYLSADSSTNLDGSIDVIGMVRDGVDAVEVELEDGGVQRVQVADNVYAAHLGEAPKAVHVVDPEQGDVSVHIAGF
jgi:hypothetical protein